MKAANKIVRSHYADSRIKDVSFERKEIVLPINQYHKIKHNIQSIDTTVNNKGKFKVLTEPECLKVMSVLRQANTRASVITLKKRMIEKRETNHLKRLSNHNYFKKTVANEKNQNSLRNKIKLMRKQKIFPQPVGPTNYRKQYGMLPKIVIK